MGNFVKHAVAVGATALIISATTAPSVHAGGLIADLLKPVIGEKAARELDKKHEELGKPLDKAVAAGVAVVISTAIGVPVPPAP